jgi:hypothetical protein
MITSNLIETSIYLAGALLAWRMLRARCVTLQLKALLIVTFIWGIAGASVSLH